MEECGQLLVPATLLLENMPLLPIEWEAGLAQSQCGCFGEEKSPCFYQESNYNSVVIQLIA
jgi:hypothetical protein